MFELGKLQERKAREYESLSSDGKLSKPMSYLFFTCNKKNTL